MNIGKFSYYARKIHRILLFFVVIFGLIQIVTGLTMKYPQMLPMIDPGGARLLHFQTATYFTVVFGLQMITGLIMYFTPWLLKQLNLHKTPILR